MYQWEPCSTLDKCNLDLISYLISTELGECFSWIIDGNKRADFLLHRYF